MSQIENTISALAHHFNKDYTNLYRDRLDREVKTMELQCFFRSTFNVLIDMTR